MKKEVEASRTTLNNSRNSFKDKYQKITDEIVQASSTVNEKYEKAQVELNELKDSMGEVAKLHDTHSEREGRARRHTEGDRRDEDVD